MRLLLLTPFLPDGGAAHGGGVYLASLCRGLAATAEVGVVALVRPDEEVRVRAAASSWSWIRTLPYADRPTGRGRRRHQLRMLWRWRRRPLVVGSPGTELEFAL